MSHDEQSFQIESYKDNRVQSGDIEELRRQCDKNALRLDEYTRRVERLETEKKQLQTLLDKMTNLYEQQVIQTQAAQNNLIHNIDTLKVFKKEIMLAQQQKEQLLAKIQPIGDTERTVEQELTIKHMQKELDNKESVIKRLKGQNDQNGDLLGRLNTMSDAVSAAKKETEETKQLLQNQKWQKVYFKRSLTTTTQKNLQVEQEFNRLKTITKIMGDNLLADYAKERCTWKEKHQADIAFYKGEYEMFKGFVEDIIVYLKKNGLYATWSQTRARTNQILSNRP